MPLRLPSRLRFALHRRAFAGLLITACTLQFAAHAGSLTGSLTVLPLSHTTNLTDIGSLDWVRWGQFTEFMVDRKGSAVAGNRIGDFTAVTTQGNGVFDPVNGPYYNNPGSSRYSWRDGVPTVLATNTAGYAYIIDRNNGFRFTVPADTTPRRLRVFVGAADANVDFSATLSDGSAGAYSSTALNNNSGEGPDGLYTLIYAANSPGQTLTVTVLCGDNGGSVRLLAAALSYPSNNNPPSATITLPKANDNFLIGSDVSINAIASDAEGSVTNVAFFVNGAKLGEDLTAPYSLVWSNAPAGRHLLRAVASDNLGATNSSGPVEIFVTGTNGSLVGSGEFPPFAVNLTSQGSNDWTHWGLINSNSFNRKSNVTAKISNFTVIGTNMVRQYADNFTQYSWSDGTPTDSAFDTPTGVFVFGQDNGFELTLPASLQSRTVKVYVGLFAARANFQAWLTDFSAPPYIDDTLNNFYNNTYRVYTITYQAASAGQSLKIRHTAASVYDRVFGNVTLQAATLAEGAVPLSPIIEVTNLSSNSAPFGFSFTTDAGPNYIVEYTDALEPALTNWITLSNLTGTGGLMNVIDPGSTPKEKRFYRVRRP